MGKVRLIDATEWVQQVKELHGEVFYFKDLPAELQKKPMLMKAKAAGLIKRIERSFNGKDVRNKWRIMNGKDVRNKWRIMI